MKKKGDILVENVIFIVLNVIFISILLLFLWGQGSGAILVEETHAKQISLLIDSAKPGMEIRLNMVEAKDIALDNGIEDFGEVVSITDNVVRVKLSEKGGYEYSFFNDVSVNSYYAERDALNEQTGIYYFKIDEKNE